MKRELTMSKLLELIKALMPTIESQHVRDEAYLAESVDIYDLERRMREIDRRGRNTSQDLTFSLGLR
jgi:hypothetical protein